VKFITQVIDYLALRYLAYRGLQHLRSGFPPIASFAFDHIGHEINLKGRYEAADLDATVQFLRESGLLNGIAVDVGANIGNHSVFFARHFKRVLALEPNPRVFDLLSFNTEPHDNIQLLNIGASDMEGEQALSFDPENWGGAHLLAAGAAEQVSATSVTVQLRTLDDLEELSSSRVGLLKVDVEGHELRVLKGAAKLLTRSHPVILFEQHADEIAQGSSAVVDWLRDNGYRQFLEVRSFPGVPRSWKMPGRKILNGLLRIVAGERKKVVLVERFEKVFYPMIIALPSR